MTDPTADREQDSENVTCPAGCDLTGEPIPEASRHLYGGSTHFSRRVAYIDPYRDRVSRWECPDCGESWARL